MKIREWFRSVWAEMTAPNTDEKEIVLTCRLAVKKTNSGFLVTPEGCQKHSTQLKRVGDHFELGEVDAEAFGKCLLVRVVRAVSADATTRVKLVDDHDYGFVCSGDDGCKSFYV